MQRIQKLKMTNESRETSRHKTWSNNAETNVKRTSVAAALESWGLKSNLTMHKVRHKNSHSFKQSMSNKKLFETNTMRLIPKFNNSKNFKKGINSSSVIDLNKRNDTQSNIKVVDLTDSASGEKRIKDSVTKQLDSLLSKRSDHLDTFTCTKNKSDVKPTHRKLKYSDADYSENLSRINQPKFLKTPEILVTDHENVSEIGDLNFPNGQKDVKIIKPRTFDKRHSNQDDLPNFASDNSDTSPMRLVNIVRQSSQDRDPWSSRLDDSVNKISFSNTSRLPFKSKTSLSKNISVHRPIWSKYSNSKMS